MKKNWLLVPKLMWGIWWILMRAVASLKICTLMCYFCQKHMFEPKKYRGVTCHNTEEWCKIRGGTDLCFEKWHKEFGEFWSNTQKSQNLHFNGLLLTKVYNVWTNKLQRSYVSWHWMVIQYLKKNWLVVWKMTRNLVNFHASSPKPENMRFDGFVLSKVYKVEGTLSVKRKSLTTVLDEVHFIVNLYSFPLPLDLQANLSYPKVSHFSPPWQNNFQNSPLFFC